MGTSIRKSSAYYPQSNGRAEAGVKSLKRVLRGNTGRNGSINTDNVAKALLQYRNTPLREINKSPAELALGRQLRDTLPIPRERYKVHNHWAQYLREREHLMSQANDTTKIKYDEHSKELSQLTQGDTVLCQNTRSKKWDKSGVILETGKYRQYTVKMDGSSRLSTRNRRHLQKIVHIVPEVTHFINNFPQQVIPLTFPSSNRQPEEDHTTNTMDTNSEQYSNIAESNDDIQSEEIESNNDIQSEEIDPSSPEPNLRRSQRNIKKPFRYYDEFKL